MPKTKQSKAAAAAAAAGAAAATAASGDGSGRASAPATNATAARGGGGGGRSRRNVATSGVMDYIQKCVPKSTLLQLYTEENRGRFVCRAVLQRLSSVSQQVAIRLTCTGGSFPVSGVRMWVKKSWHQRQDDNSHVQAVFRELHQWAIIRDNPLLPGGGEDDDDVVPDALATDRQQQQQQCASEENRVVALTAEFAEGLQVSLCSLDTSPWIPVTPQQIIEIEKEEGVSKPRKHVNVTPEDLERHTRTQWDAVLHFLVGTTGKIEPPTAVVQFLLQTGLMQPDPDFRGSEDDAPLVITQKGYDFMLQDNSLQVWHFVVQYIQSFEMRQKGPKLVREVLLLLICLSFSRVGDAYLSNTSVNKRGRTMIQDLSHFGLLYTRKVGGANSVFYPTRVAMQLVGGGDGGSGGDDSADGSPASNRGGGAGAGGFWTLSTKALESALSNPRPQNDSSHLAIIVQTNFQVCAYTTSELHVSMLSLFCDIKTIRKLPNIVFMSITRDSIKWAFSLGIQARQILRFLEKHSHPKLRNNATGGSAVKPGGGNPLCAVPGNVEDQIWLWDREQRRVRFTEVYEHQCLMAGEFRAVLNYSNRIVSRMSEDPMSSTSSQGPSGPVVWSSERRQQILVNYRYVERVQRYVRQWRVKNA